MILIAKNVNLVVRFLLEICVLISIGYWGFKYWNAIILKLVFGIGAPFLVAFLWATFGSPKARIPLDGVLHVAFELVVMGSGVLALYFAGQSKMALCFGVILLVNRVLMLIWGQ